VVKTFDIDAVVDTGDDVDWGSAAETSYVSSISSLDVPYIYVRGNHDSSAIQSAIAKQKNAVVLDNTITTVDGLTIAGIGDPEFTPDKSTTEPPEDPATSPLLQAGQQLADTVRAHDKRVDFAMLHDPAMAPPLSGVVPLVLAGHLHHREVSLLPAPSAAPPASASPSSSVGPSPSLSPADAPMPTRLMVEGSTGGAGLRGLEKDKPTPLELSVLYFDENHNLKAYDDIQLGGTGESNVEMQRNVIGAHDDVLPAPTPSDSSAPAAVPEIQPSR
jgi:predicted phosphodiesterase